MKRRAARSKPPGPESRTVATRTALTAADWLCLGLVVAVYCCICFRNIRQPGSRTNELTDVNGMSKTSLGPS